MTTYPEWIEELMFTHWLLDKLLWDLNFPNPKIVVSVIAIFTVLVELSDIGFLEEMLNDGLLEALNNRVSGSERHLEIIQEYLLCIKTILTKSKEYNFETVENFRELDGFSIINSYSENPNHEIRDLCNQIIYSHADSENYDEMS